MIQRKSFSNYFQNFLNNLIIIITFIVMLRIRKYPT